MKRERAVWKDEEDELVTAIKGKSTKVYGRKPFIQETVHGNQKWATKRGSDDSSVDTDSDFETFLASTSVSNAISKFRDDAVKPKRRQDLNIDARSEKCGSIGSVTWQPLGRDSMDSDPLVAFSSFSDKEVRVCKVYENGKRSEILTALKFKNLLPKVVKFVSETELLITSRLRSGRVAIYDCATQKSTLYSSLGGKQLSGTRSVALAGQLFSVAYEGGNVVNIDRRSKQWASELRLNHECVGLNWSAKDRLYLGDERSNIYQYDCRNMAQCVSRTRLETTSSLSSFAMNGDALIACGSPFGTVDILDDSLSVQTSFDNLVTPVDNLSFHPIHRSLLLASSKDKRNAVRFFECSSGKTMPGWPTANEVIGRALNSDFSDCGRFLSVGCKSGRVQLFAL